MSIYGTSVVRRLSKLQVTGLDDHLLNIAAAEKPTGVRGMYYMDQDPEEFADYAASIYRKDYWVNSPVRVEVWVEKDAMAGKLKPVVRDEYGLALYVSRGFASETYLQKAGAHICSDGRLTYVYLLTDFDASGMGIAKTVEQKLAEMASPVDVFVKRIAATLVLLAVQTREEE